MILTMTSPTSQATTRTIRAELARRQLSQRDLAEKLGTSQGALSRRMTDVQPWDLDELHAIAELFHLAVYDLLATSTPATT